ncbi:hypothetical protein ACJX0J_031054, partial [Zea mays]
PYGYTVSVGHTERSSIGLGKKCYPTISVLLDHAHHPLIDYFLIYKYDLLLSCTIHFYPQPTDIENRIDKN